MLLKWALYHLILAILFVIAFVTFVFVTRGRRPVSNILTWLFFIFLVPYIGIFFFIIFGQRKLTWILNKKRKMRQPQEAHECGSHSIQKLLSAFGVWKPTTDNHIELLANGTITYHRTLELINSAKKSLLISTYIVGNDEIGDTIINLLTEKAKSGVEVCLLLDTIGSFFKYPHRKLKPLKKAGGSVRYIMPLLHIPFRGRVNLRDHRKIMIIDANIAMIGGMNLATQYMGPTEDVNRWHDVNFILKGCVVAHLLAVFESDWQFAASHMENKHYHCPQYENYNAQGNAVLQIVPSGPDTIGDNLYDALISSIYNAQKSIYIVTPYFILDDAFQKAFLIAIRRGIDVNIILPRNSNHPTPDLVRSISVRKLRDEGAKIWLHPQMLHAKIFKFDDDLAVIGSANLDLRSLLLNFEISCFVYSKPEIQIIDEWIQKLITETDRTPKPQTLLKTWLEDAAQLLKPLL